MNLCIENAMSYGEDGGFCYDEIDYKSLGLSLHQMKGYLGKLVQKGYLLVCEDCYFSHVVISLKN